MKEPTPETLESAHDRVQKLVREAWDFCRNTFGDDKAHAGLALEIVRLALDAHAVESHQHKPDAWSQVLTGFMDKLQAAGLTSLGATSSPPAAVDPMSIPPGPNRCP